jgi:hypothetical protein
VRPELERQRLEHRARRLRLVVETLRARTSASVDESVPPALHHALTDFSNELGHVRALLDGRRGRRYA